MDARGIAPDRIVLATAALLFVGSAAVTLGWCASMADMPGMNMPGGWTMSMTWMRMPGQGWWEAAASFIAMWTVMMVAMMLPSLLPALRGCRPAIGARLAVGYFGVWMLLGFAIYPVGTGVAAVEMQLPSLARMIPALSAVALAIAGLAQLSNWKLRQLDCCRSTPCTTTTPSAWRRGVALGLRCCACCAPLTAALLVVGMMDLAAMACATLAISLERLAPRGRAVARLSGTLLLGGAGAALARAAVA